MSERTQEDPAAASDDFGFNLLLYGNEQILRGSDNGVLLAFAALALQQVREDKQPHYYVGFGFFLVSVLLCALVHFLMGNAYVGRARLLIRKKRESRRQFTVRSTYVTLAWCAGV